MIPIFLSHLQSTLPDIKLTNPLQHLLYQTTIPLSGPTVNLYS